jgi:sulfoxide reductase heme-binding subunit YedZ
LSGKGVRILKAIIAIGALAPAAMLVFGAFTDDLTANPIEYVTHETGSAALVLLLLTLSVTPLRRLTGWNEIIRLRRMLGLFAFFYASLHFLTWAVLDQFFDVPAMIEDVAKRPYITVGMAGFLLMVPLAMTSTAAMIRRLGRRWQTLHRVVYLSAVAGVVHFWWLVKADVTEPRRFAFVLAVLLGARVAWLIRGRFAPRVLRMSSD